MKTYIKAFTVILLPLLFLLQPLAAQKSNRAITADEQKLIIDKAFQLLKANYIFPDKLVQMEKQVYKKSAEGAYAKFTTAEDFIRNFNIDLESLSNDRHIDIFFDPVRVKQIRAEKNNETSKPAFAPEFLARARYENYMMRKVERMDGNLGYLKFNAFVDPELSKPTMVAAMNFLSNSSALIIDLRQNGGGDAGASSFLLNYFLPDATLLMHRRSRMTNENTPVYTTKDPHITKFPTDVPVYILTGKRTSSAAEAFAYTLQAYRRAIIVGDTTNGEANPGYLFALNDEMYMMIPAFENVNPVTKTNWQGKGVIPDIKIPADKALMMAQAKAYEQLSRTTPVKENKLMYDWMATGLLAELQPIKISEQELRPFAGDYADTRHIIFTEGALYYYRGENAAGKKRLIPMKPDLYAVEGVPFFRIRFIKDSSGNTTALEGIYDDGTLETSKKL